MAGRSGTATRAAGLGAAAACAGAVAVSTVSVPPVAPQIYHTIVGFQSREGEPSRIAVPGSRAEVVVQSGDKCTIRSTNAPDGWTCHIEWVNRTSDPRWVVTITPVEFRERLWPNRYVRTENLRFGPLKSRIDTDELFGLAACFTWSAADPSDPPPLRDLLTEQ